MLAVYLHMLTVSVAFWITLSRGVPCVYTRDALYRSRAYFAGLYSIWTMIESILFMSANLRLDS